MKKLIINSLLVVLILLSSQQVFLIETHQSTLTNNFETSNLNYLSIDDYTWNTSKFYRDQISPMQVKGTGGYDYSITTNELHVEETGDTFESYVGIYTTVNITGDYLAFSLEARARANHEYAVSLAVRLVDPDTMKIFENGILGGYSKKGGYDTGWNYAGYNISALGHSELILLFYYNDAFITNWHTEFWIRNLKVYTSGETDVYSNRDKFASTPDLNWTVGNFERAEYEDMYFHLKNQTESLEGFSYNIAGNNLHFEETGEGTYDAWIGAYTTVTVNNGYLALSYKIKAKANYYGEVSAHCRLFNAQTGETLGTNFGQGLGATGVILKPFNLSDFEVLHNYLN